MKELLFILSMIALGLFVIFGIYALIMYLFSDNRSLLAERMSLIFFCLYLVLYIPWLILVNMH